MPQGLVTSTSACPPPSRSASGPIWLSAVLSSQPPNLVPLGAITGLASVLPDCSRIPMPQGLVTSISARPSPPVSPVRTDRR